MNVPDISERIKWKDWINTRYEATERARDAEWNMWKKRK